MNAARVAPTGLRRDAALRVLATVLHHSLKRTTKTSQHQRRHTPHKMPATRIVDMEPHGRTAVRGAGSRFAGTTRVAREQSGQALVEFAIVLLPLAALLFGATQFGLALNSANDPITGGATMRLEQPPSEYSAGCA